MSDNEEINLGEQMEKPLSDDIINEMAASSEEERLDLILYLEAVNGVQAQLISRMLKTLKVEHTVFTDEEFSQVMDEALKKAEKEKNDV